MRSLRKFLKSEKKHKTKGAPTPEEAKADSVANQEGSKRQYSPGQSVETNVQQSKFVTQPARDISDRNVFPANSGPVLSLAPDPSKPKSVEEDSIYVKPLDQTVPPALPPRHKVANIGNSASSLVPQTSGELDIVQHHGHKDKVETRQQSEKVLNKPWSPRDKTPPAQHRNLNTDYERESPVFVFRGGSTQSASDENTTAHNYDPQEQRPWPIIGGRDHENRGRRSRGLTGRRRAHMAPSNRGRVTRRSIWEDDLGEIERIRDTPISGRTRRNPTPKLPDATMRRTGSNSRSSNRDEYRPGDGAAALLSLLQDLATSLETNSPPGSNDKTSPIERKTAERSKPLSLFAEESSSSSDSESESEENAAGTNPPPRFLFPHIPTRHIEKNPEMLDAFRDRYAGRAPAIKESASTKYTIDKELLDDIKAWFKDGESLPLLVVDGKVANIRAEDVLRCFWQDGLDSTCEVCGQSFTDADKGPPIRTVACADSMLCEKPEFRKKLMIRDREEPLLRVFNRHMGCIKSAGIRYYAVSHVWHEEIRTALLNKPTSSSEPHRPRGKRLAGYWDPEATTVVLQVLVQTAAEARAEISSREILSSTDAAVPKYFTWKDPTAMVEIWHDYISAPQWCKPALDRVLFHIPQIYKNAAATIVHLDDISLLQWMNYWHQDGTAERVKALKSILTAAWFERMWTLIEFLNSTNVEIMLNDYAIVPPPSKVTYDSDGSENFETIPSTNTIRTALELSVSVLVTVAKRGKTDFQKLADTVYPSVSVFEMHKLKSGQEFTLGSALSQIASRNVTFYRDRFIGLCDMLCIDGGMALLSNNTEACKWLYKRCLALGDYTPLLLSPKNESKPKSGPTWLVGHEKMQSDMWTLGATISPATHVPIITDQTITLLLDHLGDLVTVFPLQEDDGSMFEGFKRVLDEYNALHKKHNGPFSIETFIDALSRIYGAPATMSSCKVPITVDDFKSAYGGLTPFSFLLDMIKSVLDSVVTSSSIGEMEFLFRRLDSLAEQFIVELQLDKPIRKNNPTLPSELSRLDFVEAFPGGHQMIGCRCQTCRKSFLFRAEMYSEYVDITRCKLYRIPGLGFEFSGKDSVAIVVRGQDIVGRALYARKPCACEAEVQVEFKCEVSTESRAKEAPVFRFKVKTML